MLKLTTLLPATVSLLMLGAAISFVTQFIADSKVYYNYSDLPAHCNEHSGSSECIPPMESESQGFPVRYQATFFKYGETTQKDGVSMTEVGTANVFYWPNFIVNSLIWSAIALVAMFIVVKLTNYLRNFLGQFK